MCDLVSAAGLAISAVSAVMQYQEQQSQANAQTQMIQDGLAKDRAATQRQYEEINAVAQDDSAQRHKEFLIDQARIKAIGAESGLSGATQGRIEDEVANDADTDLATIEANRQRRAESAHTQGLAKSTQAGIQLTGIRRPSALGVGLQIGGAGVKTYSTYDESVRRAGAGKGAQ